MPTSPSIQNYMYGSGVVYLKLDGESSYRHVGNVPSLVLSKQITKQSHRQSMSGLRSVDDEVITEVGATVNATLEEVTPQNMALFMMGTVDANTDGHQEINGLSLTTIKGHLKYISDNPKGRQIEYYAYVSITPNGDFNFLSDDVNTIPVQMTVLKEDGVFGRMIFIEETA